MDAPAPAPAHPRWRRLTATMTGVLADFDRGLFRMLMAFLADMLISRRLNHGIGRRRARGASGHVVVLGLGAFGIKVAGALVAAGQRVVAIDRDAGGRFLADASALDVPVIFGDATLRSTLEAAGVADAAAIAIMTSNDLVNIETALAVRDLLGDAWGRGPTMPVAVRIFDRGLGRTVADRFGFRGVQSTEELATVWFVGATLGLDMLGSFPVGDQPSWSAGSGSMPAPGSSAHAPIAAQRLGDRARPRRASVAWSIRPGAEPASAQAISPTWLARTRSCSACCAAPGPGDPGPATNAQARTRVPSWVTISASGSSNQTPPSPR